MDSLALRMPPLDVAIRDARRGDADEIAPLLGALGYPTSPAQFARRFELLEGEPATWIYVAEADGRLVGLAGLRVLRLVERDELVGRLIALVVGEEVRGMGVGRALVEHARNAPARRAASSSTSARATAARTPTRSTAGSATKRRGCGSGRRC